MTPRVVLRGVRALASTILGTRDASIDCMLERWKDGWHELAHDFPGQRFTHLHERHRQQSTAWLSWLYIAGAVVCAAVGVVLSFIPGPAFVFFILAGGLLATQSRWAAGVLDRSEVWLRGLWKRWRERRAQRA